LRLELAIDLIVPDNTAYTVLVALRELGYEALERVERSQIIALEMAPGVDESDVIEKISHAEVLFNPNKHRLSYVRPSAPSSAADGAAQSEAVVTDNEDDTRGLVALLAGPFHLRGLQTLSRGVAWRLFDVSGPASRERLEWACRQLLANQVSQRFEVRPMPVRSIGAQAR
jgi:phosphoribosylformylglycinamidine (FGAM) synthase PurS component